MPLNHIYKLSFLIYPSVYFSCKEADKNELEASPSLIADLKSPVMIILYRLIYSLLTHRDFDSYSVNTLSYPLSSIVNYQEHAQGQT